MKNLSALTIVLLLLLALAACKDSGTSTPNDVNTPTPSQTQSPSPDTSTPNTALTAEPKALYGEYILFKTLDIDGNDKVSDKAVVSMALFEGNIYELVFIDGVRSLGKMETDLDGDKGLGNREWQYALRDDRNDNEPSYNFLMRVEDDGSICLLMIPQGVEDDSWVELADFWFFE